MIDTLSKTSIGVLQLYLIEMLYVTNSNVTDVLDYKWHYCMFLIAVMHNCIITENAPWTTSVAACPN